MLESIFIFGDLPLNAEKGTYQIQLVVLSYVIASFASYAALSMAQQLVNAKSAIERGLLHWAGAFALGAGIWAMHFVGMLSYKMNMMVEYDPAMTILSMLIAIAVAYGVLSIVARNQLYTKEIISGGILLGLGICSMHYTGMAAMKMDGIIRYIPSLFALSVLIAILSAIAALEIAFALARHGGRYRYLYQLGAAFVLGAGICGMHYTGMLGAVFVPDANCRYDPNQDFDKLALSVAGITLLILSLPLAAGIYRKAQMEYQLQSSESKLRAMMDNALDAVIAMDQDGKITEWNRRAEAIFGWSHSEVVGRRLSEIIIPPEFRSLHEEGLRSFLKDGIGPILNNRIEVSALHRAGAIFPVELSVSAYQLQNEHHFTAFLRNISERKESERQLLHYTKALERSNQELDEFAYIASHDLKEPLRGIQNHASFLLEDYQEKLDEDGVKRLNRLIFLTQRMERLISDLLHFSRLGRADLAIQKTDTNVMIDEIHQLLESFLKEKNAQIRIPNPLPEIICDRPRVTELFRNLITNAVKYNDKEEKIVEIGFIAHMDAPHGSEKNVFYVKDNGIGIKTEFFEEIFRIFKRLNTRAEDKEAGTGVGLTFVKKIVERHKGRIWVESTMGEGSVFYFTLESGASS